MPKKSKKTQAENPLENESEERPAELAQSASTEQDALASAANESNKAENEPSMDDLLDDVRRSLMEEESEIDEKKPKIWNRLTKVFQKDQNTTEVVSPTVDEPAVVPALEKPQQQDAYIDQIDELINMLDTDASPSTLEMEQGVETHIVPAVTAPPPPPPSEPEPQVNVEEMKKRLFDQ